MLHCEHTNAMIYNIDTSETTSSKGKGKCLGIVIESQLVSSALQSRKWQLNVMRQWCGNALCGHPLASLTDSWMHDPASRHTIAPISHISPSPRSNSYYSLATKQLTKLVSSELVVDSTL